MFVIDVHRGVEPLERSFKIGQDREDNDGVNFCMRKEQDGSKSSIVDTALTLLSTGGPLLVACKRRDYSWRRDDEQADPEPFRLPCAITSKRMSISAFHTCLWSRCLFPSLATLVLRKGVTSRNAGRLVQVLSWSGHRSIEREEIVKHEHEIDQVQEYCRSAICRYDKSSTESPVIVTMALDWTYREKKCLIFVLL